VCADRAGAGQHDRQSRLFESPRPRQTRASGARVVSRIAFASRDPIGETTPPPFTISSAPPEAGILAACSNSARNQSL